MGRCGQDDRSKTLVELTTCATWVNATARSAEAMQGQIEFLSS